MSMSAAMLGEEDLVEVSTQPKTSHAQQEQSIAHLCRYDSALQSFHKFPSNLSFLHCI